MAARGQRRSGGNRNRNRGGGTGNRNKRQPKDNEGIIPILAQAVRSVENAIKKGRVERTRFQAIALIAREERARLKADETLSDAQRDGQLKRLDGIATILAQSAAREPSLFDLLQEDAEISEATRRLKREMELDAGLEPRAEQKDQTQSPAADEVGRPERRTPPPSVTRAQLANPFMTPDFSAAPKKKPTERRLMGWELIEPLLNSFANAEPGASSCLELPDPKPVLLPDGRELMKHQAQLLAKVAEGHRTFLLADEPGLGKTAQSLLAAQAAGAFPLLAVVPNVVKPNWAHEAEMWVPGRSVSVVHGDGEHVDGFADLMVVNYEILDRHVDWIGDHGFRGMIVDEAHFIKNKKSQRSQNVLEISDRIRQRVARPLMMALTGTPLINDIEDFLNIWQFLGWIDEKKPRAELMHALEEIGLTPADLRFYPAARQAVVDMGIVRRRKVDVAADIPARRVADLPVELDEAEARSIREAERELAERLVQRYDMAIAARRAGATVDGLDHALIRQVAHWELSDSDDAEVGDNVFAMVRRIGRAKAVPAADYAAQLARSAGKVVFFAKHLDVMDAAGEVFDKRDIRYTEIRGDQTRTAREEAIRAFTEDEEVQVIVCSLTAAGVGINLQVASDVVLAELSWTDAEQTQAIDRVHRIGQTMPVTAWRMIAAQTIDARIAGLIDSKAGLAARALDGSGEEATSTEDIRVEALVALLTDALESRA